MRLKDKLRWVAGIAAAAFGIAGPSMASATRITCAFQTWNTGKDAVNLLAWEKFTFVSLGTVDPEARHGHGPGSVR